MKKVFIAVMLICIVLVVTVAGASLSTDLTTQRKLLSQELSRLDQLEKAVIQQTAIVNQRQGILGYIQYQIEQEKTIEKIYENEANPDEPTEPTEPTKPIESIEGKEKK